MPTGPTLVTGAAGFAGSHLLDRLSGRDRLIAWHRPDAPPPARDRGTAEWRAVDLLDRAAVGAAVAADRPSRVYHLAGVAHVGDAWKQPLEALQVHVLGTHYLLEAVRQHVPTCRVLVVSSALIYTPGAGPVNEETPLASASPYGLSKIAEDQLALTAARDDGLDVVVARPFNHAGPRQTPAFAVSGFARQIARIERGEAPPEIHVGNLDARRDLTDVRDVVHAYERIMDSGVAGRVFNVCTGEAHRIGDVLDRLLRLSPARITTVLDAERLRPSDLPLVQGDPSRIRAELGWTPAIPLDRLLADVLDWWRSELGRTH
jgi:GDP-4-dehydro-6-deoxy-D-mannose reductase